VHWVRPNLEPQIAFARGRKKANDTQRELRKAYSQTTQGGQPTAGCEAAEGPPRDRRRAGQPRPTERETMICRSKYQTPSADFSQDRLSRRPASRRPREADFACRSTTSRTLALRPSVSMAEGCAKEVGRPQGADPRPRPETPRFGSRRDTARLRDLRGDHPKGQIGGRYGLDLGPRQLRQPARGESPHRDGYRTAEGGRLEVRPAGASSGASSPCPDEGQREGQPQWCQSR